MANLILKMRQIGAASTARGIHKVRNALLGTGLSAITATGSLSAFGTALTIVKVRVAILTFMLFGLSAAFVVLIPMVIFLIAAGAALGAAFGVAALIVIGVVQRFKDNASTAGTAASELTDVLFELKHAWNTAVSPAASVLMRGLSEALVTLLPVIQAFREPLRIFAVSMSDALMVGAQGAAALAPELMGLFTALAPMLPQIAAMMVPLAGALIDIGVWGVPALQQLVLWLMAFAFWLRPALQDFHEWVMMSGVLQVITSAAQGAAGVIVFLAGVVADLWTIAKATWPELQPFAEILGGSLLWGVNAVADAIDWMSRNTNTMGPIIAGVIVALVALKVIVILLGAALTVLNVIMAMNPWVLLALIIVAVVYAVWRLYQRFQWVRDVVNGLWNAIKALWWFMKQLWGVFMVSPLGLQIRLIIWMAKEVWNLLGGWSAISGFFKNTLYPILDLFVIQPFLLVLSLIKKTVDALGGVKNIIDMALPGGDKGFASKEGLLGLKGVPGLASGGYVRKGGVAIVGEHGPEPVSLPTGSTVHPSGSLGGDIWIAATFVTPDGEVLARQTVKAAKKQQSTR